MTGKPYAVRLAMGVRRPRNPVLGRDVAGTVAETGPGVTGFAPGDEVYGVAPGSFASSRTMSRQPGVSVVITGSAQAAASITAFGTPSR